MQRPPEGGRTVRHVGPVVPLTVPVPPANHRIHGSTGDISSWQRSECMIAGAECDPDASVGICLICHGIPAKSRVYWSTCDASSRQGGRRVVARIGCDLHVGVDIRHRVSWYSVAYRSPDLISRSMHRSVLDRSTCASITAGAHAQTLRCAHRLRGHVERRHRGDEGGIPRPARGGAIAAQRPPCRSAGG